MQETKEKAESIGILTEDVYVILLLDKEENKIFFTWKE